MIRNWYQFVSNFFEKLKNVGFNYVSNINNGQIKIFAVTRYEKIPKVKTFCNKCGIFQKICAEFIRKP